MRIIRTLTAVAAAALTAGGALVASTPATAQESTATQCVPAAAVAEQSHQEQRYQRTVPAVTTTEYAWSSASPGAEWFITDAEPRKVVDQEAVPGQDAVTHEEYRYSKTTEAQHVTEYEFRHALLVWKTRWERDPNWNANGNPNSLGWFATGETRQVETAPESTETTDWLREAPGDGWAQIDQRTVVDTPAVEPVPEKSHVEHQWSKTTVVEEARTETSDWSTSAPEGDGWTVAETRTVVDVEAQPAVDCRDDVTVTAVARCYDGQAGIAVRVDNGTGGPLTVRSGPTSSVTWAAVEVTPGASFYQTFLTGSDTAAAGKVVAALRNAGGYWTATARYDAVSCATTTPVDQEEPTTTPPPAATPPSTGSPAPAPVITAPKAAAVQVAAPVKQDDVDAQENGETYALATTGTNPAGIAIGAALLVAVGVIGLTATRRRQV